MKQSITRSNIQNISNKILKAGTRSIISNIQSGLNRTNQGDFIESKTKCTISYWSNQLTWFDIIDVIYHPARMNVIS